jgi:hypothetical protein
MAGGRGKPVQARTRIPSRISDPPKRPVHLKRRLNMMVLSGWEEIAPDDTSVVRKGTARP